MKTNASVVSVACLIVGLFATTAFSATRQQIIERELKCASGALKTGLSWEDICYTRPGSSREPVQLAQARIGEPNEYQSVSSSGEAVEEGAFDNKLHSTFRRSNPLTKVELGFEVYDFNYEEPNFMEDEGYLYGFFGAFTKRFTKNKQIKTMKDAFSDDSKINMVRLESRFAFGEVDYTSQGTGSMDDVDDYVFEIRGLAGYDFPMNNDFMITPFLGFGFRYLNDDSGGRTTTTGAAGYERESHYYYIPVGVELTKGFDQGWSVALTAEYDWFLVGEQESHLGDAVAGLSTVSNDQEEGYGLRGAIRVMKETEKIDYFFEPFVRFWHIDDSQISAITYSGVAVGFGLEPENESVEAGFRLGARY